MGSLGTQAATLGIDTAKLGIKTLQTGVNIASEGLGATENVATAAFNTTSIVAENSGKIVSSASGIVADTVGITEDLIKRIHVISENATSRQQDIENLKNSKIKEQSNVGIVKNTEGAQVDILTIQKKAENEKKQIELNAENERKQIERKAEIAKITLIADADKLKRKIEADADTEQTNSQINKQLSDEEKTANQNKINESLEYGFKIDQSPYEIGSTEIKDRFNWFTKRKQFFFGYYVPIGVLNRETFEIFNIALPKKSSTGPGTGRNEKKLICKDDEGNDVTIEFKPIAKKRWWLHDPEIIFQPVVTVTNNENKRIIIEGELLFQKRSYFIYREVKKGGKSRRQIKKHRVGYKKSQKTKKRNNTKTRNKRCTKL